jgi:pheromone shutdown protein TraB
MIKKIENFILLGTSHVSRESIKEIRKVIDEYNPDVVAIELDDVRLKSLLTKNRKKDRISFSFLKEVGLGGYLFGLIAGFIQDKVGKSLGINPGADMLEAYKYSKKKEIKISLVDVNIVQTLKKLSKLSFFKKLKMFSNLFFKSFKKEYRENLDLKELKKGEVPDEKTIELALNIFKKEVPELYKILIEDRNIYMVKNLFQIYEKELELLKIKEQLFLEEKSNNKNDEKNKNLIVGNVEDKKEPIILAVVGAGHLNGMLELLEKEIKNKKNVDLEKELLKEVENKDKVTINFKIQN